MNSQQRILLQPRTTLEAMRAERERLNALKQLSRQRMTATVQSITRKEKAPADRLGTWMNIVQNGLAVYQGMRMGASFIAALRKSFGRK